MVVLLMIIMIFTMSVKQYIYNYDPQTETTELFGDCKINITYIKMSDHYYAWELYSSLSKWNMTDFSRQLWEFKFYTNFE